MCTGVAARAIRLAIAAGPGTIAAGPGTRSRQAPALLRLHHRLYRPFMPACGGRLGDHLLNVAWSAAAVTVRPCALSDRPVMRRLAGTPCGRLNEKSANEPSSPLSGLPLSSSLTLICRGPVCE